MRGPIVQRTVDALLREINASPWRGTPAKTIFFGGGTPTFLSASQLVSLLEAVFEVHPPVPDAEITSEANPGTADAEKFAAMRAAGFNRLSLGAQSFFDDDLVRLGRVHNSGEIERAVALAKDAGFDNINVDLMYALPGQSLDRWKTNLDRAISLNTDHLSLYCLTLEPNTAFYKEHLAGRLIQPDEDQQLAMDEIAEQTCESAGFSRYEISNYAKPGCESRHNLCYWRGEPYAAYGPGAVGCMPVQPGQRLRYTNWKHPLGYCQAIEAGTPATVESEAVDARTMNIERIMLGLRLSEGVPLDQVQMDPKGVEKCLRLGWIALDFERVKLTSSGRRFCSEVAVELIPPLSQPTE